jgi:ribosomal protein L29
MKIADIRSLPDEEIRTEIQKARELVFKERFHGKGTSESKPGLIKAKKRDIARMLTVLNERKSGVNRG